MIKKWID